MQTEDISLIRSLTEARDPEFLFAKRLLADAGINLAVDGAAARLWLKAKAEVGDVEAQLALAKLLVVGLGGKRDLGAALALCEQAASHGYPPALVLLASFYVQGWGGIHINQERALKLLHQAADAEYATAMALLSVMYEEGIGTARSLEKAINFRRLAAEYGDAGSQFLLACQQLDAKDKLQQAAGVKLLLEAANQNLPSAHRRLADLYSDGSAGLLRDEIMAKKHRIEADRLESDL